MPIATGFPDFSPAWKAQSDPLEKICSAPERLSAFLTPKKFRAPSANWGAWPSWPRASVFNWVPKLFNPPFKLSPIDFPGVYGFPGLRPFAKFCKSLFKSDRFQGNPEDGFWNFLILCITYCK